MMKKTVAKRLDLADDEEQITEWLKELKAYRETYPYGIKESEDSDCQLK